MANNEVQATGRRLSAVPTYPASPTADSPVLVGQIPGVALTNADGNGAVTLAREGVFNLSVKGEAAGSNAAIAAGDIIYYDHTATPPLCATNTGVRFGYALDPVSSGATTTIRVAVGY